MAAISQFITYGYLISDGMHVAKAVKKHLPLMKTHGATETEIKQFHATIEEAKQYVAAHSNGPTPLEATRQALKDRLGDYRAAARNVVTTINGVDAAAEKDLQMKGSFPATDLALNNYFDAIEPHLDGYSAKLAARGFSRVDQAALREAGAKYKTAFAARGLERGEAKAATLGREGVFKKLQTEITYFRTLGHESLRKSNDRKDFDRVKIDKAPTAQQVAAKKAAAAAKKAAAMVKKAAKQQTRKPALAPAATGT